MFCYKCFSQARENDLILSFPRLENSRGLVSLQRKINLGLSDSVFSVFLKKSMGRSGDGNGLSGG